MNKRAAVCAFLLIGLYAGGFNAAGAAQGESYPVRAIRLVVPFPPGGGTDIVARTIGQKLGERLGQSVVIDNRGGAGGNIGAEIAAKGAPDGYTLFVGAGTHAVNMTLYDKPGYNLAKDFEAVSPVASTPLTLVSNGYG